MSKIYDRAKTDHAFRSADRQAAQDGVVDLMEAAVAAYALMAHSDGEAVPSERRELFATLHGTEAMAVFSRDDISAEVSIQDMAFRSDPAAGERTAHAKLSSIAHRRAAAGLVMRTCARVMQADGILHPEEYRQIAVIGALLGLDAAVMVDPEKTFAAP